jgi:hypothetical protein
MGYQLGQRRVPAGTVEAGRRGCDIAPRSLRGGECNPLETEGGYMERQPHGRLSKTLHKFSDVQHLQFGLYLLLYTRLGYAVDIESAVAGMQGGSPFRIDGLSLG